MADHISIRIPADQLARIDERASALGQTRTGYMLAQALGPTPTELAALLAKNLGSMGITDGDRRLHPQKVEIALRAALSEHRVEDARQAREDADRE